MKTSQENVFSSHLINIAIHSKINNSAYYSLFKKKLNEPPGFDPESIPAEAVILYIYPWLTMYFR